MKVYSVTINLFVSLVLTVALSSCAFSKRSLDGVFTPDCKQFGIGSICFQNTSSESVEVEMKDVKMEVLAFTTLCMDVYEGEYEYKVKKSKDKWKEEVLVARCKERKVKLEEEGYLD